MDVLKKHYEAIMDLMDDNTREMNEIGDRRQEAISKLRELEEDFQFLAEKRKTIREELLKYGKLVGYSDRQCKRLYYATNVIFSVSEDRINKEK